VATIRTTEGEIEAGYLLGDSAVLVRLHDEHLFVFRRTDSSRTRIGRRGAGPGEFRQLVWSQPGPESTLLAYDHANRRLTVFSAEGEVRDIRGLPSIGGTPVPLGAFEDGTLLVLRNMLPSPPRGVRGVVTDSSNLLFLSTSGEVRGPTLRVPMRTLFLAGDASNRTIGVPLGPRTEIAVTSSGFYMGHSGSPTIGFYDATGILQTEFTLHELPLPVPSREAARLREAGMNRRGSLGLDFTELYRDTPIPDTYPWFGGLVGDHSGRVWVKAFPAEESMPVIWTLYGAQGARVRSVALPPGSRLLDASETELLIVADLPDGDEVLQILRVAPPAREPT